MKLLVVGPSRDFEHRPFDGFTLRHGRLIRAAQEAGATVSLIALTHPGIDCGWRPEFHDVPRTTHTTPERSRSRLIALRAWQPDDEWARSLLRLARAQKPDAVVTLGPWLDEEYSPLYEHLHVVHVAEEDLTVMREIASQRRRARALRRVARLSRRLRVPSPAAVVVIGEGERERASQRWRSPVVVLPQTLAEDWPRGKLPRSEGTAVLCVGVLAEERNAEGLDGLVRELTKRELPKDFVLRLVSASGLHPAVTWITDLPWVEVRRDELSSPVELYRSARMALVPALRATGVKATVLQAWACSCPVVTYRGSAETIHPRHRAALLARDNASELADAVLEAWSRPDLLDALVAAGRRAMSTDHDDQLMLRRWRSVLRQVAAGRPVEAAETSASS